MKKVLIVGTGNSCRSQIAEGYLRYFAGPRAEIYSAGTNPLGVHPFAIDVMSEEGIDLTQHTSNHVDEYAGMEFNYLITVCDSSNEVCPHLPGSGLRFHYHFKDPATAKGSEGEQLAVFREVRDEIRNYAKGFAKIHLS